MSADCPPRAVCHISSCYVHVQLCLEMMRVRSTERLRCVEGFTTRVSHKPGAAGGQATCWSSRRPCTHASSCSWRAWAAWRAPSQARGLTRPRAHTRFLPDVKHSGRCAAQPAGHVRGAAAPPATGAQSRCMQTGRVGAPSGCGAGRRRGGGRHARCADAALCAHGQRRRRGREGGLPGAPPQHPPCARELLCAAGEAVVCLCLGRVWRGSPCLPASAAGNAPAGPAQSASAAFHLKPQPD